MTTTTKRAMKIPHGAAFEGNTSYAMSCPQCENHTVCEKWGIESGDLFMRCTQCGKVR